MRCRNAEELGVGAVLRHNCLTRSVMPADRVWCLVAICVCLLLLTLPRWGDALFVASLVVWVGFVAEFGSHGAWIGVPVVTCVVLMLSAQNAWCTTGRLHRTMQCGEIARLTGALDAANVSYVISGANLLHSACRLGRRLNVAHEPDVDLIVDVAAENVPWLAGMLRASAFPTTIDRGYALLYQSPAIRAAFPLGPPTIDDIQVEWQSSDTPRWWDPSKGRTRHYDEFCGFEFWVASDPQRTCRNVYGADWAVPRTGGRVTCALIYDSYLTWSVWS